MLVEIGMLMLLVALLYKVLTDERRSFILGPYKEGGRSDFISSFTISSFWGLPTLLSKMPGNLEVVAQEPFKIILLGVSIEAKKQVSQGGTWYEIKKNDLPHLIVEVVEMKGSIRVTYATKVFWTIPKNESIKDGNIRVHQFNFLKALMASICTVSIAAMVLQIFGIN